jgi:uncharacterized protein
MNTPLTYRLNPSGSAAQPYYPAIAEFTNQVLAKAENSVVSIAREYRRYIINFELENPRSIEEYTFELLNFGILWRTYGHRVLSVRIAPFRLLALFAEWRKHHRIIKTVLDPIRGLLMSLFLVRGTTKQVEYAPKSMQEIERLVQWLEATGDFREDAFRYIRWLAYWGTQKEHVFIQTMNLVLSFSDWFEHESLRSLGSFTPNVDFFLAENEQHYRWREDRFSCLRSRVEYHLNMVGAEIMNRAFRSEFLAAEHRTVLVPGCMRIRTAEECEGTKTSNGVICSGCVPKCHVNQLRMLGLHNHFDVCIMPHSTDLSRWAAKPGAPSSAVVGVACLSVLVQGGWELRRWNVPAQCVLLNQCGCKKHWNRKGFPTELDVRELKRIMQNGSIDAHFQSEPKEIYRN